MWGHWAHRVSRLEVEGQAFVFGCAGFYLAGYGRWSSNLELVSELEGRVSSVHGMERSSVRVLETVFRN
jgi:hypothetical protein